MKIDEELIKKMQKGVLRFGAASETGFKKLADFGWYINADFSIGYTTNLMEKAIEGDLEFLNNFFVPYYRTFIQKKTNRFKSKNKLRSDIIKEAIDCHNEKRYYASTMLFLSQSDGICGGYLFKGRERKQDLKKFLATSSNGSIFLLLLNSIKQKSSIDSFYPEESNVYESELNRHGVMHGYNIEYGTETNSLKAFSLFCFVNDFVNRYSDQ